MDYNQPNYNNGIGVPPALPAHMQNELTLSTYLSQVMRKVYVKMTLGLLLTALVAWGVAHSEAALQFIFGNQIVFWGLMIAELALVVILSAAINKLSSTTASLLFYLYSALNGVTMSMIFLVYTGSSIALTFAITSGTFLAMSIYGYTTKQDLSKFGTFLIMALIGLIICTIVNIFMKSTMFDMIISGVGVLLFVGLTAWDTQKIKNMAMETDETNSGKLATIGALSLYLDFINLFLYLLRFFGSRD